MVSWDWRGDNSGPPGAAELISNFDSIQRLWPNRTILMSTFEEFVNALDAAAASSEQQQHAAHKHTVRGSPVQQVELPEYTNEMGDTWIHGVGSDPLKVARWRAVCRLRSACLRDSACPSSTPAFYNFSRLLLKAGEHTWSTTHALHAYSAAGSARSVLCTVSRTLVTSPVTGEAT